VLYLDSAFFAKCYNAGRILRQRWSFSIRSIELFDLLQGVVGSSVQMSYAAVVASLEEDMIVHSN